MVPKDYLLFLLHQINRATALEMLKHCGITFRLILPREAEG